MSVWRSPCYNIEAPRNTLNNYPEENLKTFPDELKGVFNFNFGDCSDYHPELSERHAATVFKESNEVWTDFCKRTRTSSRREDPYKFRATICATNVKYSGIKAVYWIYKAIAEEELKIASKLDEEVLNSFIRKLWNYTGPGSRINKNNWKAAGDALWSDAEDEKYATPDWFKAEGTANAFNYLWTANNSPSFKRQKKRTRILVKTPRKATYYTKARVVAEETTISKGFVPKIPAGKADNPKKRYDFLAKWVYDCRERPGGDEDSGARSGSTRDVGTERETQAGTSDGEEPTGDSDQGTAGRTFSGFHSKAAVTGSTGSASSGGHDAGSSRKSDVSEGATRAGFSRRLLREVEILPYVQISEKSHRWKMFRFDGGYIIYDERKDEAGIFYTKDHQRVAQMLKSRAQLIKYYSKYAVDDTELNRLMISKFNKLEELFLTTVDVKDADFCNWVCRACDVTQFKYLAGLADDINDKALSDQDAKIAKEGLDRFYPVEEALKVVVDDRFGVKEELELLKFYKLFPCPDFCVYSAVSNFKKKSSAPNPCTWAVPLILTGGEDYSTSKEEFRNYTLRNRLITFKETHGYLPGKVVKSDDPQVQPPAYLRAYPDVDPLAIALTDVHWIDFKGTFLYRRYDGCEEELVKDKSTAGKIKDDNRWSGNQVLEYLFRDDFKKQKEINDAFREGRLPNISKMEILLRFKAEAKKPGSRLFSMATDEQRRQLSELEANIATYARNCRGSSQGKSDIDMNASLTAMASTLSTQFEELLISFDLAAFSPKMSPEFKEFQYETWAYCFGEDDIMPTLEIFRGNEVVMDLFGLDDRWKLEGNDLEGFNARMNTVMHAEVMGYCVYKLKQIGVISKRVSADLEALIDDGLLKLYFPRDRFHERVNMAVTIIEKIYMSFGLEVSWDKTFVSQIMCQYLNRVYYDGMEVTPGAKAFMRIGKVEDAPVPSLSDELEAVSASARGAIKSGSDHRLAYWAYIWEFTMTLVKWSKYNWEAFKSDDLAFRCLFPISLGGFGINSLYGLSTNSAFNSTVACLANVRMVVFADAEKAAYVNSVLNAGVRDMSLDEVLRAPTAIRSVFRNLNSRRFANSAREYVMAKSSNPFLKYVVRRLTATQEVSMADVIAPLTVINEFQRSRLAKIDPNDFLEKIVKKLQTSGTAARMLGKGKVVALTLINRSEARVLINEAAKGKFSRRAIRASYI